MSTALLAVDAISLVYSVRTILICRRAIPEIRRARAEVEYWAQERNR